LLAGDPAEEEGEGDAGRHQHADGDVRDQVHGNPSSPWRGCAPGGGWGYGPRSRRSRDRWPSDLCVQRADTAAALRYTPRVMTAAPAATFDLTAFCPVYHHAVELVGRRWTGAILRALLAGETRFSAIGAAVPGLSDRLLSQRLKELEAEGVVERHVSPGPPERIEYHLTSKGE